MGERGDPRGVATYAVDHFRGERVEKVQAHEVEPGGFTDHARAMVGDSAFVEDG